MGRERPPEEVAARKAKKDAKREASKAQRQATLDESLERVRTAISTPVIINGHAAQLQEKLNHKLKIFDPELKKSWLLLTKAQRQQLVDEEKGIRKTWKRDPLLVYQTEFPFPTEASDHCETSPQAYAHIAPLLKLVASHLGKAEEKLRIYDPYFCSGAVERHLKELGFPSVYNKCEDFYKVIEDGKVPKHDVIVSNPPYSEDSEGGPNHVARLLKFCTEQKKPFILNMPEYVASSAYYEPSFEEVGQKPLLISPLWRYHFWTPVKLRGGKKKKAHMEAGLGVRNSPFVALWYISLEPVISNEDLLKLVAEGQVSGMRAAGSTETVLESAEQGISCQLCQTLEELPSTRGFFEGKAKYYRSPRGGDGEEGEAPAENAGGKAPRKGKKRKAKQEPQEYQEEGQEEVAAPPKKKKLKSRTAAAGPEADGGKKVGGTRKGKARKG